MASADDLLKAMDALAKANERLVAVELERQRREAARDVRDQANAGQRKADTEKSKKAKEKEKADEAEAKTRSNPLGKLVDAFRASKGAGGAAGSGNLSGALKGLMGAGEAAGVAGGAAGVGLAAAVSSIGLVAGAAFAFKAALDQATDSTISHYRELSKMSGSMAAVMAQRDFREAMRQQEIGNRTAGSAGRLTTAEQDRADAGVNIEVAWTEFKAGFLTKWNSFMTAVMRAVDKWLDLKEAKEQPLTLDKMLDESAKKTAAARERHRGRVNNDGDF